MRLGLSRFVVRLVLVVLSFLGSDAPLLAQVASAEVVRLVTDPAGGPVPGATVAVTRSQRIVNASSPQTAMVCTPRPVWRRGYTASTWSCPDSSRSAAPVFICPPAKRPGSTSISPSATYMSRSPSRRMRRWCARRRRASARSSSTNRSCSCRSTAARSSRSRRSRRASRCRPTRSCRASTAAGRARTSISSTAFRCCSRSPGRSRTFRSSTRFRSSRSRATARRPSSADSTAASST